MDNPQIISPSRLSPLSRFAIQGSETLIEGGEVGTGDFASVIEVTLNGKTFAGKKYINGFLATPNRMKWFVHQCEIMSNLDHKNVVKFVGLWFPNNDETLPVFILEKLDQTINRFLRQTSSIPLPVCMSILEDTARGLHYLHTRIPPIIHRDINTATVLLDSLLVAKIGGFGRACMINEQQDEYNVPYSGYFEYMPPEALLEDDIRDVSLDIFAFGQFSLYVGAQLSGSSSSLLDDSAELHEIGERRAYFVQLESKLPGGKSHPLIALIKQCLSSDQTKRPTSEQLLITIQGISEEGHLQACKQAIHEKGSLEQIVMQAVFFGLPRSGKTSLKNRLVGKKVKVQASTGVAEKVVQVRIGKSAVQVSGTVWNEVDDMHDITYMIMSDIYSSLNSSATVLHPDSNASKESAGISRSKKTIVSDDDLESTDSATEAHIPLKTKDLPSISPIKISLLQKRGAKRRLLCSLRDPWTIYMTDSGGQPIFQELLPVLVSGPTIFFLIFPLDKELNQKYKVEYLDPKSGRSAIPYEANSTVLESLMQSLASIVATQRFKHLQSGKTFIPKVLFIGTHKDCVTEGQLKAIDKNLLAKVKKTDAFKEGMIELASESEIILPVNNLSESDEDIETVRAVIHRIGTRSNDYLIPTPYPWLIFSMNLNLKESSILSYDECFQLAKECGIESKKELDDALWFLHNYTGTVRHFQGIPQLVIKDPQYIFDKVTEMIVNTFTFERIDPHTFEEFTKKGIFPFNTFKKLSHKSDPVSPQELIMLLEQLHIVAPIIQNGLAKKYFLPCALTHAPIPPHQESNPVVPSLYLTFSSGYCPKGLFGSLVAHLMGPNRGSDFEDWELEEEQIFRNQVSFAVTPYDSFRFVFSPSYIRVDLTSTPDEDRMLSLGSVCCDVRECVQQSITHLFEALHYNATRTVTLIAFACPGSASCCNKELHTAKVFFHKGKPISMTCSLTRKNFKLPHGSIYWFDENAEFTEKESTLCSPSFSASGKAGIELSTVCKQLTDITDWHSLGLHLGIRKSKLDEIRLDFDKFGQSRQREEMLYFWLRSDKDASWKKVREALESMELHTLAHAIKINNSEN